MDVRWTPGVGMIAPRVGTGLDGHEAVIAFRIGKRAAATSEIGIERRRMLVYLVGIAPGGIGLPDFHQRMGHRPTAVVEDAPGDQNSLPHGRACVLPRQ